MELDEIHNIITSYTNVLSDYIDKMRRMYNISETNNIKISKIKYIDTDKYEIYIISYSNLRKEYELSSIINKYSLLDKLRNKIYTLLKLSNKDIETLFIIDDVQLSSYSNKLLITITIGLDDIEILSNDMGLSLNTKNNSNILSIKKNITNMYAVKSYPNIYSLLSETLELDTIYENILYNYDSSEYIEAIKSYNSTIYAESDNFVSMWLSENKHNKHNNNNIYKKILSKYNIKYFLPSYDEYNSMEDELNDRKNISVLWDLIFRVLLTSTNKEQVGVSNDIINNIIYTNAKKDNVLYTANVSPILINRLYYYDKEINKNKNKYSMSNYVDSHNMRKKIFNQEFIYIGFDNTTHSNVRYDNKELEQMFDPIKEDMSIIKMNTEDNKSLYISLLKNTSNSKIKHHIDQYKVFYTYFFMDTIKNNVCMKNNMNIVNDNTQMLFSYISLPTDNINYLNNYVFLVLTRNIIEKIYNPVRFSEPPGPLRCNDNISGYTSLYYCIIATLLDYTIDNINILKGILSMMDDSVYLLTNKKLLKSSSIYHIPLIFGRLITDYQDKIMDSEGELFYILDIITDIVKNTQVKKYISEMEEIIT